MADGVNSGTFAGDTGGSPMIELLRWVGWEPILGYQRSSWPRSTVLGPRHLVGITFADEATALAVVALMVISMYPRAVAAMNAHSGFDSSHFFLRRRHVPQPVLVRLANCCPN